VPSIAADLNASGEFIKRERVLMKESTMQAIEHLKVICICRRLYGTQLLELAKALNAGGIGLIEVTFDQADPECIAKTTGAISMLADEFEGKLLPGAGTVTTVEQVNAACEAGARYIISPNTDLDVIVRTKQLGLVSIPGATTPSEILAAHKAGADYVKLFPSGYLGFSYIKDILGPISHVKLMATGGVSEENLPEYLKLGFAGAGVSGRLSDKALIAEGNFAEFTRRAAVFMDIVGQYR
jgi:2-dehydro-3-deoxyphosphogluconate aldolase/(4S)-4-hydroxy-2-oxoglutarate aldolase